MPSTISPWSRTENYAMTMPTNKGPLDAVITVDFEAGDTVELDLTQLIDAGWMDFISGVYIDNVDNPANLTVLCNGTNQQLYFGAYKWGYVPLMLPNPPKIKITADDAGRTRFHFYNVPQFPWIENGPNAPSDNAVDIVSVGGIAVTDYIPVGETAFYNTEYEDWSVLGLSGASEFLLAANSNRRYMLVHNCNAVNPIAINCLGLAAAINGVGSITLPAGATAIFDKLPPTNAINVIGTLGDNVTCYEGS